MNVTLNIELFILVMHLNHFLKGCNNVNSCLKLKHDLSSQIPNLGYNFCQVNELFETLSTSNLNNYREFEYSEQRASNEIHCKI